MSLSSEILIAFAVFALVTSITPGPNNIMLLTSGVNFGFKRTILHIMGVTLGFSVMVFLVGLGLGAVFEQYPILYTILCYVSAAYLIYLAWQIMHSGPVADNTTAKKPMTFLQAAAFQWVNPKAWIMAIAAITTYVPKEGYIINALIISLLFSVFVAPSGCVWTMFGTWLRRFLNQPLHLRIFNGIMATLLLLSLYPLFVDLA
jgi:threonine/homoserine/homoserine lactone efflux protein